jgi:hypothetical protein
MKIVIRICTCVLLAVAVISCADLEDLNEDPNKPTTTSPQLLLTTVCWDVFKTFTRYQYESRMLVSTDGESPEQFYKWTRKNFDLYDNLRNIQKLEEEAMRVESDAYLALAKFFKAWYFYNLTLQFGDIPFSEALKGEKETYTPKYDTQEDVFVGILELLEDADKLLEGNNQNIDGDILNKSSLINWQKLTNAFRLKVLLTLSHKTNIGGNSIASAFKDIYTSKTLMNSIEESTQLKFIDQSGSRYFNFNSSSFGSGLYMDSTFVQKFIDREDPRLFVFCTQTPNALKAGKAIDDFSSYEGGNPTVQYSLVSEKSEDISKPHSRYYNNPVCESIALLGYPEQQFIIAEAILRGWISGDATAEYNRGIKASFEFFASQPSTSSYSSYLNEQAYTKYIKNSLVDMDQASADMKLSYVLTQKYMQSYFQAGTTPFFEQRRTGYPTFETASGVAIPNRWMYPQAEYDYNKENLMEALSRQFDGKDEITGVPWYLR